MIYCPHCNRPTARTTGTCPHCKRDLGSADASTAKEKPITPPISMPPGPAVEVDADTEPVNSPNASARNLVGRSDEYTLGQDEHRPLTTISVPPPGGRRSAPSSTTNVITESEVRDLAGYGIPGAGVVDAMRYFLRVRKRRTELLDEQRRRTVEAEAAATHKRRLLSRLGQEAHRLGIQPTGLASSIEQALEANREHAELRNKAMGLANEHKSRVEQLERERASIEELCRPLREIESEVKNNIEQLSKARRGIEVQKKRAEIELRNLDEGIARKQQAYADPERSREEKDVLLREISAFDNQRPPLLARLKNHEEELSALASPLATAELRLGEVRGKLAEKLEQVAKVDAEINRISEKYSTAEGMASQALDRAMNKADELWSVVGQRLIEDKPEDPGLAEHLQLADATAKEAAAALVRRMLVDRAVDSYDKAIFEKGKKILLAAGVVAALVLVLAIIGLAA